MFAIARKESGLPILLTYEEAEDRWIEETIPVAVTQFSGKKDFHSKKMFEGDVVEYDQHLFNTDLVPRKTGVIIYDNGQFMVNGHYIYGTAAGRDGFKVIGNVFENPELGYTLVP
jgi:hypothetical protein